MDHTLIDTVVISLVLAFILGFAARKVNLPPLIGYLLAGVMVGPYTPGFVGDVVLAQQLAEIGIILLMFGVGLHFSFAELLKVRRIAIPGALFQMLIATVTGLIFLQIYGYNWSTGLIFGLSLSVASTVVLLRSLEEHKLVRTETGKIATGWLIVEDLVMVLILVLLPVLADLCAGGIEISFGSVLMQLVLVLLKISGFVFLIIMFGRRMLPWLLISIARTRSSELTTLGTLAVALGFAYIAYTVFDASFALGAFFAGLVLHESRAGYKAAEKSLPMRDAFAVLFFVSVGMLFNPAILIQQPWMVILALLVIIVGKSVAALAITAFFRQSYKTSLTVAASLAQIGEFSFILAGASLTHGMITQDIYNIILAGALISIAVNPLLFKLVLYLKEHDKPQ